MTVLIDAERYNALLTLIEATEQYAEYLSEVAGDADDGPQKRYYSEFVNDMDDAVVLGRKILRDLKLIKEEGD